MSRYIPTKKYDVDFCAILNVGIVGIFLLLVSFQKKRVGVGEGGWIQTFDGCFCSYLLLPLCFPIGIGFYLLQLHDLNLKNRGNFPEGI